MIDNNYCTEPYCLYAYCAPVGEQELNSQLNMIQLGNAAVNVQLRMVQYNIDKLRILWQIASDGIEPSNFTASSSASLDKNVINLKSDILEKYWQSTGNETEWVQWDAGLGHTISMDTFAVLAHTLSSSAVLRLKGYGDGNSSAPGSWAAIPVYATIPMSDDPTEENTIWVSPTSPATAYRHWRLEIQDPTNADDFVRIGRLVGGSALIFNGENCLDNVEVQSQNFSDSLSINGFTAIANNRALKKLLGITFKDLNAVSASNYRLVKRFINYNRDTLKALVIVDPSSEVLKYRYSAFAKLRSMPTERHRYIDNDNTYSSLELVFDEAR